MRRTKIVATTGPATHTAERIGEMIAAGMDVARLNYSHGTHADHAETVAMVREASRSAERAVAILQDLQGPKIRTGPLVGDQPVELVPGQRLVVTTEPTPGDANRIGTSYPLLPRDVAPGDRLLLSDGLLELRVLATGAHDVTTEVYRGGTLRPRQGINLPGVRVSWPSLTPKDLADLKHGVSLDVDYVAVSFVRKAADVTRTREALAAAGSDSPVIAKLERPEALDALDAIIAAADGVMVARGDLGVEIAPERVPVLQKEIIAAANRAGRPVITATQMLESMITAPRPTRAEVSDVANAILDGSDAVMLSGETSIGRFPVDAVAMMARIGEAVEDRAVREREQKVAYPFDALSSIPQGIAAAVSALVRTLPLTAVCVVTRSGTTARLVSRYRPHLPIYAFTPLETAYQRLSLLWGVTPVRMPYAHTEEAFYRDVRSILLERGLATPEDQVVVTGGQPVTTGGPTNMIRVLALNEPL